MKLDLEAIYERDVDLLLISKFLKSHDIVELYSQKVGIAGYHPVEVGHSVQDSDGESDIVVILENINQNKKTAFLIEDKIDACAMPNQRGRYDIRGQRGVENGNYDDFYVFITAPQNYLTTNSEAHKYENQVSYEELAELFEDDIYAQTLLSKAIREKRGYRVIEDARVTTFWSKYYDFISNNYPSVPVKRIDGPRGSAASWNHFPTPLKGTSIVHKMNSGRLDLGFLVKPDSKNELLQLLEPTLPEHATMRELGKTIAVSMSVPKIDQTQEFTNFISEMRAVMDSVTTLYDFLNELEHNQQISHLLNKPQYT